MGLMRKTFINIQLRHPILQPTHCLPSWRTTAPYKSVIVKYMFLKINNSQFITCLKVLKSADEILCRSGLLTNGISWITTLKTFYFSYRLLCYAEQKPYYLF